MKHSFISRSNAEKEGELESVVRIRYAQETESTTLDLSNLGLERIPPQVSELISLESLLLDDNRLQSIGPEVAALRNLRTLSLINNKVSELPEFLADLDLLKSVFVSGNPIVSPPAEIVARSWEACRAYLKEIARIDTTRMPERIVVIGHGGVGKTSLIRALTIESFSSDLEFTQGITTTKWSVTHTENGITQDLDFDFWEFGGAVLPSLQQIFLPDSGLVLVVHNARQEDNGLEKTLDLVASRAPRCKIIAVATHASGKHRSINEYSLIQKYPQLERFLAIDFASGLGVDDLRNALTQVGTKVALSSALWPRSWVRIGERLDSVVDEREGPVWLAPEEFEKITAVEGVEATAIPSMKHALHVTGRILHYPQDPVLSDYVLAGVTRIPEILEKLLDDQAVRSSRGLVENEIIEQVWANHDAGTQARFMRLLELFDLAIQVGEHDGMTLFPSLLPVEEKSRAPNPRLHVRYSLKPHPPGVIGRLIARCGRFNTGVAWSCGLDLAWENERARVSESFTGDISLKGDGSHPSYLMTMVDAHIEEILREFPGTEVFKEVPCGCEVDSTGNTKCNRYLPLRSFSRNANPPSDFTCPDSGKQFPAEDALLRSGLQGSLDTSSLGAVDPSSLSRMLLAQRAALKLHREAQGADSWPSIAMLWKNDRGFELRMFCEAQAGWHPARDERYNVGNVEEARCLLPIIGHTLPLLGAGAGGGRADIPWEHTEFAQATFEELKNELLYPDSALRPALDALLAIIEPSRQGFSLGGLQRTRALDGSDLWLCPFHQAAMQRPLFRRDSSYSFDAFLSHSWENAAEAKKIVEQLRKMGLKVWLDKEQIRDRETWEDALVHGLREAATIIVLTGKHGWGPWQLEEVLMAHDTEAGGRRPVIPVHLGHGTKLPQPVPAFLSEAVPIVLSDDEKDWNLAALVNRVRQNLGAVNVWQRGLLSGETTL